MVHSDERPFACRVPDCTRQFVHRSARNMHERCHSDVRPHLCPECGRTFKSQSYLKRHAAIVHVVGERPALACATCDRVFRTPMALNFHTWNRHTNGGVHECAQCAKRFTARQQLGRHLKVHSHTAYHLRYDMIRDAVLTCTQKPTRFVFTLRIVSTLLEYACLLLHGHHLTAGRCVCFLLVS